LNGRYKQLQPGGDPSLIEVGGEYAFHPDGGVHKSLQIRAGGILQENIGGVLSHLNR
jgi:hypothetical protein